VAYFRAAGVGLLNAARLIAPAVTPAQDFAAAKAGLRQIKKQQRAAAQLARLLAELTADRDRQAAPTRPVAVSSQGELYEYHRQRGTLHEYYRMFGIVSDAPPR